MPALLNVSTDQHAEPDTQADLAIMKSVEFEALGELLDVRFELQMVLYSVTAEITNVYLYSNNKVQQNYFFFICSRQ